MWVKSCKFTDDKADYRAFSRYIHIIRRKKSSMQKHLHTDIKETEREKSMPAQRAKELSKNK